MSIPVDELKVLLEKACNLAVSNGARIRANRAYISEECVCPLGALILANLHLFNLKKDSDDNSLILDHEGDILLHGDEPLHYTYCSRIIELDKEDRYQFISGVDNTTIPGSGPYFELGQYFRHKYCLNVE